MSRTLILRHVYIRITEDGKRKWKVIGFLNRKGEFRLNKEIPLNEIFEVESGYDD
jgi:hypothetical protein